MSGGGLVGDKALTPATSGSWLRAISYVALPDALLDYSSQEEAG